MKKAKVVKKEKKIITATMTSRAIKSKETGEITFGDILRSVNKIKALGTPPPSEIAVGKKLFKDIKSKSKLKRLNSIFGVNIRFDDKLKPSEYRFIKETQ